MIISVNGSNREVSATAGLLDVLDASAKEADGADVRRGVAVAVDGVVIPRTQVREFALTAGCRVEIVTAVQGG